MVFSDEGEEEEEGPSSDAELIDSEDPTDHAKEDVSVLTVS